MKANDLTQGSILKKIILVALPVLFSSIAQMAYNLTDMFWIGRVDSIGLSEQSAIRSPFVAWRSTPTWSCAPVACATLTLVPIFAIRISPNANHMTYPPVPTPVIALCSDIPIASTRPIQNMSVRL